MESEEGEGEAAGLSEAAEGEATGEGRAAMAETTTAGAAATTTGAAATGAATISGVATTTGAARLLGFDARGDGEGALGAAGAAACDPLGPMVTFSL